MTFLLLILSFEFNIVALSAGPSFSDFVHSNNSSEWCHSNLTTYVPYRQETEYPEFDCCMCSEGWPRWFRSVPRYRACKVRTDPITNATSVVAAALMICRYPINQNPFPCSVCVNYHIWALGHLFLCPERYCYISGKERLSLSVLLSSSKEKLNPSYYDIISDNWIAIDDFRCIGLINFTNNSLDMASVLYECPTDCFFNWNVTVETQTATAVQVVRYRSNSSLHFHLFSIRCQTSIDDAITHNSTMLQSQTVVSTLPSALQYKNPPCPLPLSCLNNEASMPINSSDLCSCRRWGYSRIDCESLKNLCENVTSHNRAQDRVRPVKLTRQYSSSEYPRRRDEMTKSTLTKKKTMKRSVAYVVIITFVLCLLVIIILDLLKYCFGFDPIGDDYRRMQAKKRFKKKVVKHPPVILLHHVYVNRSNLETIPEE